mgnify:FL=1
MPSVGAGRRETGRRETGRLVGTGAAAHRGAELRIGTSGWHYPGWWGPFYPQSVKKKDALGYYASRFDAVELNAPFYRTPTEVAVRNWRDSTPENFRFAWKASRFITHVKRLKVEKDSIALLEARLGALGEKLGPVLFQLPPNMKCDRERLARFIAMLPRRHRYAFEFRNPDWYRPEILDLLADHDAAFCISDHSAAPAPHEVTASFVYIRNHGASGHYHGSYSEEALVGWATAIRGWLAQARSVWCFFDNDVRSAAPSDAKQLLTMI